MKPKDYQSKFFALIKSRQAENLNLADTVGELLGVSSDSAYRRIRGETQLTLSEAMRLASEFSISIDNLSDNQSGSIPFMCQVVENQENGFLAYLNGILKDLQQIHEADEKEIYFYANDIPLFHFFHFPLIARFKFFVWKKTVFDFPGYENKKFELHSGEEDELKASAKILSLYNLIPSTEIWNDEVMQTSLRQIEYYIESGLFANPSDAIHLCEEHLRMIDHLKKMAEKSVKFAPGTEPARKTNFRLYHNEILVGDNTILVETNQKRRVYVPQNFTNYLITENEAIGKATFDLFQQVIRKSSAISGTGEKSRNRFFLGLRTRFEKLRQTLMA